MYKVFLVPLFLLFPVLLNAAPLTYNWSGTLDSDSSPLDGADISVNLSFDSETLGVKQTFLHTVWNITYFNNPTPGQVTIANAADSNYNGTFDMTINHAGQGNFYYINAIQSVSDGIHTVYYIEVNGQRLEITTSVRDTTKAMIDGTIPHPILTTTPSYTSTHVSFVAQTGAFFTGITTDATFSITEGAAPVPEPSTYALITLGLLGLYSTRRKLNKK